MMRPMVNSRRAYAISKQEKAMKERMAADIIREFGSIRRRDFLRIYARRTGYSMSEAYKVITRLCRRRPDMLDKRRDPADARTIIYVWGGEAMKPAMKTEVRK